MALALLLALLASLAVAQPATPSPSDDAVKPEPALSPEQTDPPPVESLDYTRPDPALAPEQNDPPPVASPGDVKPDPARSPD